MAEKNLVKEMSELTKARIRQTKELRKEAKGLGVDFEATLKVLKESRKEQDKFKDSLEDTLTFGKDLGKKIEKFAEDIPFVGKRVKSALNDRFGDLGTAIQDQVLGGLTKSAGAATLLGRAMAFAMGPIGLFTAALALAAALFVKIRSANRDLGEAIGVTTREAGKFQLQIRGAEAGFKLLGLDATKLKPTMKAISDEFGSLENLTVANAANIERFAQNTGIAGTEIVKFNKVMMDLTGSSFDVATNMAKTAADMAKAANVSTAKVLGDIASNAEAFARFSMDGAKGMAQAAIEAAKVGASLSTVLGAADKLLDFESSLTAQFEAQVLTGKKLNLEKARQLALDGDIAGLTTEVQSVVGSLGDIQSMNVIERDKLAAAIGISVRELQQISRGEQIQGRATVQDKLDVTNKLLAAGNEDAKATLEKLEGGIDTNQTPNLFQ